MWPLREGRAVHAPNRGRPSLLEPGRVAIHEAAAVIRGPPQREPPSASATVSKRLPSMTMYACSAFA